MPICATSVTLFNPPGALPESHHDLQFTDEQMEVDEQTRGEEISLGLN